MPAKFNLLVAASIPAVALVPLLACGGSSSGKTDSGIIVHDSPGSNGSGSNVTCAFPANFNATVSQTFTDYIAAGSGNTNKFNEIDMQAVFGGSASDPKVQVLRVAIFSGCGSNGAACGGSAADATPTWPNVFTPKSNLSLGAGSDGNAATPDAFMELLTDVGSDNTFQTYYISVDGNLNITAASNGSNKPFNGSAQNVDFVHIDIGTSIQQDPDGCESIMGSTSWTSTSMLPAFNGKIDGIVVEPANANDYKIRDFLRHRTM